MLREFGVHPASVIGHSSGEIAAAYASGAISAGSAITLSYFRGQAIKQSADGAMAAVGLASEQVRTYLTEGVVIACENSPQSVTLSGNEDRLVEILKNIQTDNPDTFCRRLQVSVAYHSGKLSMTFLFKIKLLLTNFLDHMQEPGRIYEDLISPLLTCNSAMKPLYSTVTGKVISDPSLLDAVYWRKNLQSTVLFNGAVQTLLKDITTSKVFVEIGPHSTLSSPLRQILQVHNAHETSTYTPTMVRDKPQWGSLLVAAGHLYINGASIQLSLINGASGKVLTDIPSYPWLHEESFMNESRLVQQWKNRREVHHELLGSRSLESSDIEPSWRNFLELMHVPWLWDHMLENDFVFPGAGYVAMIGEAIRQHTGSDEYTIRTMSIKSPLVLDESEGAEVLTSLHTMTLTDIEDSEWYEFTIIGHRSGSWRKHCVGQVRAGADGPHTSMQSPSYARQVPSEPLYKAVNAKGLKLGPRFRLLENISASTSSTQAAASIRQQELHSSGKYALHPTIIDQSILLVVVAATHGKLRQFNRLCIPAKMENISVSYTHGLMSANASGNIQGGSLVGRTTISSENKVVMSVGKIVLFSLDNDMSEKNNLQIATEDWRPHIDFLPLNEQLSVFHPKGPPTELLNRLVQSLIIETVDKIKSLDAKSSHLKKYQAWLLSEAEQIAQGVASGDNIERPLTSVEEIVKQMEHEMPQTTSLLKTLLKVFAFTGDLLEERASVQDILGDDSLDGLFSYVATCSDLEDFLSLLGHSNPGLRILEIGTPNGVFANLALRYLTSKHGTPMYSKYTITGRSADEVSEAKERSQSARGVEYAVLNINQDPLQQGFQSDSYDLIIASKASAGAKMGSSDLRNLHTLLAPGGRLLHHRLYHDFPLLTYVMGIHSWWWADDCVDIKLKITPEQWKARLLDSGFLVTDTLGADQTARRRFDISIVSLPMKPISKGRVTLLYLSAIPGWAQKLAYHLTEGGYTVEWRTLGQQQHSLPDSDVISLIDLEGPFFANLTSDGLGKFKEFLLQIPKSRILWITRASQMACNDARYALVLGVARTIRNERSLAFATFEIDEFDDTAAVSSVHVLETVQGQDNHAGREPEYEYALKNGIVHVSRFHWMPAHKQISADSKKLDNKVLDIGAYGVLSSLSWTVQKPCQLRDGQVEVDIKYIGLNFRVRIYYNIQVLELLIG